MWSIVFHLSFHLIAFHSDHVVHLTCTCVNLLWKTNFEIRGMGYAVGEEEPSDKKRSNCVWTQSTQMNEKFICDVTAPVGLHFRCEWLEPLGCHGALRGDLHCGQRKRNTLLKSGTVCCFQPLSTGLSPGKRVSPASWPLQVELTHCANTSHTTTQASSHLPMPHSPVIISLLLFKGLPLPTLTPLEEWWKATVWEVEGGSFEKSRRLCTRSALGHPRRKKDCRAHRHHGL